MTKKAAMSKSNSKFHNYVKWLEEGGIPYQILDWETKNFDDIKKCSSIVLTGGVDISPEFLGEHSNGKQWDNYIPSRDEFEFKLLDYALEHNYPILGICRGMQLINSRFKGKLIEDIETEKGFNHKKFSETKQDRIHIVNVDENSLLYSIVKEKKGNVNSSHHQAVETPGKGLMINATSDDGIIEGMEWEDKTNKPFFLAVQWHPERMMDKSSPFSQNILTRFKEETNNN